MYDLPTSIRIGFKDYKIRKQGDYRVILDCFSHFKNPELEGRYRAYAALIAFYDGYKFENVSTFFGDDVENYQTALDNMINFMNCYQPQNPIIKDYVLYDWVKDEQLIMGAINDIAKYEVRIPDKYCHWFTFMGYFSQIGDCAFSTVVSIRKKIVEHKKLEKWEQEFKINNPQYFMWDFKTLERQNREQEIMSLWNRSKRGENK